MPSTGMSSRRTAILGGSFDPVHLGHLHLMHEAYARADIRRIVIVPTNVSNFKQGRPPVSFEDRYAMLLLATEDYRDIYPEDGLELVVSRVEGDRKGVSYSSDTVRQLLPEYGTDGRIFFIVGDDIPASLPKWHDYGYLRDHVTFLCFSRGGGARCPDEECRITYVDSPVLAASSSDVREGDFAMLSKRVRRYAEDNGLYGS